MASYLAKYQDTKITVLILACVLGFLDETLMTLPVPILPNLFLTDCVADFAVKELKMNGTAIDNNEICSETLSKDIGEVCNFNLNESSWSFVYSLNNSKQHCAPYYGENVCSFFMSEDSVSSYDCYESKITEDFCREWQECEDGINVKIGIILSSKFVVRIVLTSLIAVLPKYTGFLPIYYGAVGLGILACTVYSLTTVFHLILVARLIHGMSTSLMTVGCGGLILYVFRDEDKERGLAVGFRLASMAFGSVVGPPFGGLFSYFFGYRAPYVTMVSLYLLYLGFLSLLLLNNSKDESVRNSSALDICELLLDPYISVSILGFAFAGCSVSIIESALPHWMISTMLSSAWVQGIIYLPMACMAAFSSVLAGYAGASLPRWIMALFGFLVTGFSLVLIPHCKTPEQLVLPMALLGTGFGTLDSTLTALIARFGYERHGGMYAPSTVICGASFSLGFALGPAIMGLLINFTGFYWLILGLGGVVLSFASGASLILRAGEVGLGKASVAENDTEEDKLMPKER